MKYGQNFGYIAFGTVGSTGGGSSALQITATAVAVNTALLYPHFFCVSESE